MDDKQSRLLLGMAIVLAALVGALVFLEPPPEQAEPGGRPATALHDGVVPADVEAIRLDGPAGSIALQRTPEGWAMLEPIAGPADSSRAEAIVAALVNAEAGDAIELGEAPAVVGLGVGQGVSVVLTTRDGREHGMVVGEDAPVGGGTYILDGSGALRLTRLRISDAARTDLDALRSRDVVRFAASGVTAIHLQGAARSLRLERVGADWWVEESGHAVDGTVAAVPEGRHRADGDRVADALRALQGLRVGAFPDAPLAMAEEALRIGLTVDGAELALAIGPGTDGAPLVSGPETGGPVPADLSGLDAVLAVPGVAWRSPLLLPIRPVTVDRMLVQLGEAAMETSREGLSWVDPRADAVLNALADARVSRVTQAPAPEGAPWGELSLAEGEGAPTTVHIHQQTEGGRVAQDTAGGAPFVVPDAALSALLGALGTGG